MTEEKRIYVLVAKTVQNPLGVRQVCKEPSLDILAPIAETKTIIQPPGRIAAQCAHVVSKMRMNLLISKLNSQSPPPTFIRPSAAEEEITTIILSVPDSFQLEMYSNLFRRWRVDFYGFYDENEDYGFGKVYTAICTVPVFRRDVYGIVDYLPLWDGK